MKSAKSKAVHWLSCVWPGSHTTISMPPTASHQQVHTICVIILHSFNRRSCTINTCPHKTNQQFTTTWQFNNIFPFLFELLQLATLLYETRSQISCGLTGSHKDPCSAQSYMFSILSIFHPFSLNIGHGYPACWWCCSLCEWLSIRVTDSCRTVVSLSRTPYLGCLLIDWARTNTLTGKWWYSRQRIITDHVSHRGWTFHAGNSFSWKAENTIEPWYNYYQ